MLMSDEYVLVGTVLQRHAGFSRISRESPLVRNIICNLA